MADYFQRVVDGVQETLLDKSAIGIRFGFGGVILDALCADLKGEEIGDKEYFQEKDVIAAISKTNNPEPEPVAEEPVAEEPVAEEPTSTE